MITIGILGANGQVGTEVCLYLSIMDNVKVIPICRTMYGSVFLRNCGIECRHGSLNNPKDSTELLKDCDLIVDFTYLKGLPSEIKASSRKIISNAIKYSPQNASFLFASSIMAYGMGREYRLFKPYAFARTVYGATKRYSEKVTQKLGKKFNKKTYILRISQVHGELQSISKKILTELNEDTYKIPRGLSYTVFACSIAEALLNIAQGKEEPGLYTLVSNPEWSWTEVHNFYCGQLNIKPQYEIINNRTSNGKNLNDIFKSVFKQVFNFASNYAEVIASYFLSNFPVLEKYFMAIYYKQKAKTQIAEMQNSNTFNPYFDFTVEKIPGKKLKTLSDSRLNIENLSLKIRKIIKDVSSLSKN